MEGIRDCKCVLSEISKLVSLQIYGGSIDCCWTCHYIVKKRLAQNVLERAKQNVIVTIESRD